MKNNNTIVESYVLPSYGKVYDVEVVPEVRIRSMTTAEEQKRLAHTDFPYKMLCEIVDDCLMESPGISSYDMCIGDYQFLLHKLRVVTYGSEYKMDIVCPYCASTLHESIDLDELPILSYTEDLDKYFEFDLPKSGNHIRLKVQTPRMLDRVSEKVREAKRRSNNNLKSDPSLTYTVSSLISEIDGKKPDPLKLEQWVENLPMMDVNTIVSYAEKCNALIGIDTTLLVDCDSCGMNFLSQMRMTPQFFRPRLDI